MELIKLIKKRINILRMLSFIKWFFLAYPVVLEATQIIFHYVKKESQFMKIILVIAIVSWLIILTTMFFIRRSRTKLLILFSILNKVELGIKPDSDRMNRVNVTEDMYQEAWKHWIENNHQHSLKALHKNPKINTSELEKMGKTKQSIFTMFLPRIIIVRITIIIQIITSILFLIIALVFLIIGTRTSQHLMHENDEQKSEVIIELLFRSLPLLFVVGEEIIEGLANIIRMNNLQKLLVSKFHKEYNINTMMGKIASRQEGVSWSYTTYSLLYRVMVSNQKIKVNPEQKLPE